MEHGNRNLTVSAIFKPKNMFDVKMAYSTKGTKKNPKEIPLLPGRY